MIWGGAEEELKMDLFSPRKCLLKIIFSWRPFKIYFWIYFFLRRAFWDLFFPGEGPLNFFFSISSRPSPRTLMVVPLRGNVGENQRGAQTCQRNLSTYSGHWKYSWIQGPRAMCWKAVELPPIGPPHQSMSIGCVRKFGHLSGFLRHYLLKGKTHLVVDPQVFPYTGREWSWEQTGKVWCDSDHLLWGYSPRFASTFSPSAIYGGAKVCTVSWWPLTSRHQPPCCNQRAANGVTWCIRHL